MYRWVGEWGSEGMVDRQRRPGRSAAKGAGMMTRLIRGISGSGGLRGIGYDC